MNLIKEFYNIDTEAAKETLGQSDCKLELKALGCFPVAMMPFILAYVALDKLKNSDFVYAIQGIGRFHKYFYSLGVDASLARKESKFTQIGWGITSCVMSALIVPTWCIMMSIIEKKNLFAEPYKEFCKRPDTKIKGQ